MPLFIPKDRKSLFRQFLMGMYDAVVITDPNGHIIEFNPRTMETFGYGLDDILDRHISLLIPGLHDDVVERLRKGLLNDRHVMIDANGVTRAGNKIACEIAVSIVDLMDPDDLVFTIRNVERRREQMNALRAKANAFEIAQIALFGSDRDANIRDCNREFMDLFGIKNIAQARTYRFHDLMSDAPLPERYEKALAGETSITRLVAESDDGSTTELEIVLAPNMHGTRNHGVVGSIRKIGEDEE